MKLRIKDFGVLNGERTVDLTSGISALVGPNGCGKSTIVGALFFAVTGESLTRCNLDDLISWGADTAEVELTSRDTSIFRSIIRGKGSKSSFTRGSSTLTRREEIDEAVMSMYNIGDKTAFRQVYFAEQFKAIEILEGTNSKRLEALSALLGFGRFEKYRDALKSIISRVFVSHVDNDFMRVLTEQKAVAIARCEELSNELTKLSDSLLSDAELETVTECADAVAAEVVEEAKRKLEDCNKELAEVDEKLGKLKVDPPDPADSNAYAQAVRLRALDVELATAEESLRSIGQATTPASTQLQQLRNKVLEGKMAAVAEKQQHQQRLNLLQDGKCPITQGEPCAELARLANPQAIKDAVSAVDLRIAECDKDLANIDDCIKVALDTELRTAAATAELNKVRSLMTPLEQYRGFDTEKYENSLKLYKESAEAIRPLESRKTSLITTLALLESDLGNYEEFKVFPAEQIERAKNILMMHKEAAAEASEKNSRLQEAIASRENATVALERADMQNEKATKGESAVEFLEFVRWALHKDNLPRLLVATARNELNKKLSMYLELFEFPYTVQWTPAGGIDYVNSFGELLPAASLSGGQKYLLAVANRCAAADLLGSTFPLMVLDEPTTGLDDDNRGKMAVMLQKVAQTLNGRGVSLIVPTHDDELLGSANLIKVKEL